MEKQDWKEELPSPRCFDAGFHELKLLIHRTLTGLRSPPSCYYYNVLSLRPLVRDFPRLWYGNTGIPVPMSAAPLCSSQPNLHGLCKHPYPTKLPICPQLSTSCVVASRFLNHLSERNWAHPATLSNVLEPGHNGMVVARSFVTNTTCFRPRFPSLSTLPALSSQTLQTPTDNLTSNASLKGHNFPHHLSDDIPFTHAAQRRPEDRQRRTAYVGDVQGRLRVGRGYTGGYGSNWRFWFGTSMILDFEISGQDVI